MANFPIYHGITLAANSYIENLVVEKLASDPVPVEAGRVWYNTTLKVFRQSTLNAGGAVIVRTFATVEELNAGLAAETSRAQAAEASLAASIDAEAARALAAEGVLTTDLAAEVARATAAEATELTRATAAEAVLQSNIDAEEARALAAEQSLGLRIDALGSAFNYVGTVVGGADAAAAVDLGALTEKDPGDYYKVTTAGYFKVGSGAAFFANIGDGLVFNLANGIDKIDNTNSDVTGVASFVSVTGATDTGFVVDIDSAFKGRVSTLETGLAQELVDRAAGDSALDARVTTVEGQVNGKIGELTSLSTTEKGTIVGAINEVKSQANDLQAELDLTQAHVGLDTDGTAKPWYVIDQDGNEVINPIYQAIFDDWAIDPSMQFQYLYSTADAPKTLAESLADLDVGIGQAIQSLTDNVDGLYTDLQTAINNEASRAQSVEGSLASLTTTDKTSLVGAINELNASVAGGTEAVRDAYDATIYTYQSGSAATSHVITHGLNNAFVDVGVMVQRADGSYYNDIVSVKVDNDNQVTVYLSTAQNVRVICRSAATLGLVV